LIILLSRAVVGALQRLARAAAAVALAVFNRLRAHQSLFKVIQFWLVGAGGVLRQAVREQTLLHFQPHQLAAVAVKHLQAPVIITAALVVVAVPLVPHRVVLALLGRATTAVLAMLVVILPLAGVVHQL
jgi:hypothetical protein